MAAPTKVGHVGKQPTSFDGGLGSVSRISMATQITPGSCKKRHAISKSILKVSCGPKRQRSVRQVAMMKIERLGSESSLYRVAQSMVGRWPNRKSIRESMTSTYIRPIYLAFMLGFIEMHPTVTHENSSSSGKGATRHAKFSLKTKIIFSKSSGVTN